MPLKEFAEKHDIKLPKKRTSKIWTDDKIRKKMAEVVGREGTTAMNRLNKLGYRRLTDAVRKRYGTWNAGLESEEHTSELQSRGHLVCRLLLEKKKSQQ